MAASRSSFARVFFYEDSLEGKRRPCWRVSHRKLRFPALLFVLAVASELISVFIMYAISSLLLTFSNDDPEAFGFAVLRTLGLVSVQSVVSALRAFAQQRCALGWRDDIERELLRRMRVYHTHARNGGHTPSSFSTATSTATVSTTTSSFAGNPAVIGAEVEGLDQRLSQDIVDFSAKAAQIFNNTLVLPGILAFYTYYLYKTLGLLSVCLSACYFLVGALLSMKIAHPVAPLTYKQSTLEAVFRLLCTFYTKNTSTILFLGGGEREIDKMLVNFDRLLENKKLLVWKELWVSMCTQWFAYAGSVVSYSIVGFSIFFPLSINGFALTAAAHGTNDDDSRWVAWSTGSYACMSLIYACTTLIDCVSLFAETRGLYSRIRQTGDYLHDVSTTLCDSVPREARHNDSDSDSDDDNDDGKLLKPSKQLSSSFSQSRHEEEAKEERSLLIPHTLRSELLSQQAQLPLHTYASPPGPTREEDGEDHRMIVIAIKEFRLFTLDDRRVLIPALSLTILRGMRILITGPTGVGKSTLLQTLSTLIRQLPLHRDKRQLLVCSQNPYVLLQGSLRENIIYPEKEHPQTSCDRELWALRSAGLHEFDNYLRSSSTVAWGNEESEDSPAVCEQMSPGQRQCLSIARLLFHTTEHTVALLDEVTSAMDEETESDVYASIVANVPTFVSIGHRSTIRKFHSHELMIRKDGTFSFVPLVVNE